MSGAVAGCTGGTTAAAGVIGAAAWKTGTLTAAEDKECPGSSHSSTQEALLTHGASG